MRPLPLQWLALALVLSGILAGALGTAVHRSEVLRSQELTTIDHRFTIRGERQPSARVVVVGLDPASYAELPRPPLPRRISAQVVDELRRAGASVIAFDFALEHRSKDRGADLALIAALRRARRSVVSVTAIRSGGVTRPLAGRAPFGAGGVVPGVTLLHVDPDGAVRRFPEGLGGVPSFPAAAAAASPDQAPGRRRPVSAPAGALIDYPGPTGTVRSIAFLDVLEGRFAPAAVRNKIVVVGPTAPVLQDLHPTAVDPAMPGAEIQADAIATALEGFPLRQAPASATTAILVALAVIVPLGALTVAVRRWRRADRAKAVATGPESPVAAVIGLACAIAWSVVAQVAFNRGTVLAYMDGVATIVVSTVLTMAITGVEARRERRELRRLFAAQDPEVVERVLQPPSAPPGAVTASDVVAGYRIEEQIGRGGMGVVYRATQIRLERPVALKVIRPELAGDPEYRARFQAEARLAAAVAHPSIVPVLDAGEDPPLLFIAMQYVEGITLSELIEALGILEPVVAVPLLHRLARALDEAHAHGLVHGDVKPSNVLLPRHDPAHPLLTDFGLARRVGTSGRFERFEGWVSTPDYVAPEQLEGGQGDHRIDVYALAVMLFRCLTGALPFAPNARGPQDARTARRATAMRPDLPEGIDDVLARGVASLPSDRYPSAGALTSDAARVLGVPVAGVSASTPQLPRTRHFVLEDTPPGAAPTSHASNG